MFIQQERIISIHYRTHFRHLLRMVPLYNARFEFPLVFWHFKKFKYACCLRGFRQWVALNFLRYAVFHSYCTDAVFLNILLLLLLLLLWCKYCIIVSTWLVNYLVQQSWLYSSDRVLSCAIDTLSYWTRLIITLIQAFFNNSKFFLFE